MAPITLKPPRERAAVPRYGFCFRRNLQDFTLNRPPLYSDRRQRVRIGRQRLRRRRRFRRSWHRRRWLIWHWCSPLNESFLLQPLAVNLINANEAANEIPIFLIS